MGFTDPFHKDPKVPSPSGGGTYLESTNNLSDVAVAATSFSNIKQTATETAEGVLEIATDVEFVAQSETSKALVPSNMAEPHPINGTTGKFGVGANKTLFGTDGRAAFTGDARPAKLSIFTATECDPTHQNQLSITALAAGTGITTAGLDTSEGASRRIEVLGIDGGKFVKARLSNAFTLKDVTHESCLIIIKLSTTNAEWDQAGEWRVILDIATGCVTGEFSVFMPAFSLMQYSALTMFVTCDGATYAKKVAHGFDVSLAGPAEATEDFLNDETGAAPTVINVASTTGFNVGNAAFVSDDDGSEWARITAIATDSTITVDTLTNDYEALKSAKIEIPEFVRTTPTSPLHRGLTKVKTFKQGVNSGLTFNFAIPQEIDESVNINLMLQYVPTINNVGNTTARFRVQYEIRGVGEDIPQSIQYGTLAYVDIEPPATKVQYYNLLCSIPYSEFVGKRTTGFQIARMGYDTGLDTYAGDFNFVAAIIFVTTNKLGYEV